MSERAHAPPASTKLPHWAVRWSVLAGSFLFAWVVGVRLLRVGERTDDGGPVTAAILFGLATGFFGLVAGLFGDYTHPRGTAGRAPAGARRIRLGYGLYVAALAAVIGAVLGGAGGYLLQFIKANPNP